MYNDYFGFKEAPFAIAPDPRYLFMTAQHREALAHLVYGLNSDGGCILLTGEVGTGKTTVCRCLLRQVPDNANIALVLNPKVTAAELLASICDELHIKVEHGSTIKTYIDAINRHLIASHARGERTVLIIDEAQNLDKSVLEQLRLLTNLETDQQKLLQIIILGQPELIDILSSDEMRQLAQRITARYHLKPLSRDEVKAYINHRLAIAGQNVQYFPDNVINRLYSYSKGIPRLINVLCDRALLGTYVQDRGNVDVATLDQAAREVFGEIRNVTQMRSKPDWRLAGPLAAGIAAIAIAAGIYLYDTGKAPGALAGTEGPASAGPVQITAEADTAEQDEAELADVAQPVPETAGPMPVDTDIIEQRAEPAVNRGRLAGFINTSTDDNKAASYEVMFEAWGQHYDPGLHGSACRHATEVGLSCLHKQGNLTSVKRLNRPAVFRFYNDAGKSAYALVTDLDDEHATIDTGGDIFEVSRADIDQHWLGEYTLLWQKPPYYSNALTPGTNGPMVQWLDQQLVRLYGQADAPTISDTYSQELVSQVKRFQLSTGLIPDGVAGPATLIMLNNALGTATPMLNASRES